MCARLDPDQAATLMRASGLEPLAVYPGATIPWPVRCMTCDRRITPTYTSVQQGSWCRFCARTAPRAACDVMAASGLDPIGEFPGPYEPWLCRCSTCRRFVAQRYATHRTGAGCRYCAGNAVHPDQAADVMRAVGLEPLVPYPGSSTPWLSGCLGCGAVVSPRYRQVELGSRCRYCAGNAVHPDQAEGVMRAAGMEPLVPYPGSSTPWPARCDTCGLEVARRYRDHYRWDRGCPYCAALD